MKKDLEWLTANINEDIDKASNKNIDRLYESLRNMLKKYDNDPLIKDVLDWFNGFLKSKRMKCKLILNDILEEIQKPEFTRHEELRKDLLEVSNIHRNFLENLISLLESL
jgi:hypothetical protein